MDTSGNTYVAGQNPSSDVVVMKLTPAGAFVYSTAFGGVGYAQGIAVDRAGNAYVTGDTSSADFRTVNAFQPTYGGAADSSDAFVMRINSTGSALVYSSYLGGGDFDGGRGIAVDGTGNAYVTGLT